MGQQVPYCLITKLSSRAIFLNFFMKVFEGEILSKIANIAEILIANVL